MKIVYTPTLLALVAVAAVASKPPKEHDEPSLGTSFLRPGRRDQEKKDDIFAPNPCKKYDPSSKEQYLCKQLQAFSSNGDGNKFGVVDNICVTISEIYDSNIVVDVIETAGLSLDDVLGMGKYWQSDIVWSTLCKYHAVPSSLLTNFISFFFHPRRWKAEEGIE